jgi:choline dehydrogenase-like flavoprotein
VPTADWHAKLSGSGDIFHPAGTVRIGRNPAEGVVDSDLATFRVPNLHVASTAVFPVVGGANPTMTLLLCAADLADRLAATHRAPLDRAPSAPTCVDGPAPT